jgi:hypothetical protein
MREKIKIDVLKKLWKGDDWIYLAQDRGRQWLYLVNRSTLSAPQR